MQSSGDAGIIVASFGSMVTNLTMQHANIIATAFGQIPQKVRSSTYSQTNNQGLGCQQILITSLITFWINHQKIPAGRRSSDGLFHL